MILSLIWVVAAAAAKPSEADARKFLDKANSQLAEAWSNLERVSFVNLTYLTDDTDQLAAQAQTRVSELTRALIKESEQFADAPLPAELQRQLYLLRISDGWPPPDEPKARN